MPAIVTDRPPAVTTRVAVVEGCEIIRRGLAEILASAPDIDLVTAAAAIGDAATLADRSPDVIVVAAEVLRGGVGTLLPSLLPTARVIELVWPQADTARHEPGADARTGALSRTADAEAVLRAVRHAAGSSAAQSIVTDVERRRRSAEPVLTPRQHAVLALIGEGLTNREIAERLGLTEKTVKNYVTVVLAELGVSRRTHAMAYLQASAESWPISA